MSTTARQRTSEAFQREGDPDEILTRHLNPIAAQAENGTFDPASVDAHLSMLVRQLESVCGKGENLERRLAHACRALEHLDRYAGEVRRRCVGTSVPTAHQYTIADIINLRRAQNENAKKPAEPVNGVERNGHTYGQEPQVLPKATASERPTNVASEVGMPLDSRALPKSILPTWLALVGLSWLSLLWGGIISAPFGVGAVVLGGAFAGAIAVPLWATIFGFLGMGRAREATLKGMGFQPCEPGQPLVQAAQRFCQRLDIPVPQVGTITIFNAFAMGSDPSRATVVVGLPLMEALTESETEAVLAHELGHVVSGDMARMMLMRTFQNATVWFMAAQGAKQLARWVICWGAELYILAFSRQREFWADAIAAALTSKQAMIGALEKLKDGPELTAEENMHARFMVRGAVAGMFSTHPTPEARIEALQNETYLRQLPRLRN
jgi:heat shock protein HtpX